MKRRGEMKKHWRNEKKTKQKKTKKVEKREVAKERIKRSKGRKSSNNILLLIPVGN